MSWFPSESDLEEAETRDDASSDADPSKSSSDTDSSQSSSDTDSSQSSSDDSKSGSSSEEEVELQLLGNIRSKGEEGADLQEERKKRKQKRKNVDRVKKLVDLKQEHVSITLITY